MDTYMRNRAERIELVDTTTGEITSREGASFSAGVTSRRVTSRTGSWNIALIDEAPDFGEHVIVRGDMTGQDLVQMTADTWAGRMSVDIQNVWGFETLRRQAFDASHGRTRGAKLARKAKQDQQKAAAKVARDEEKREARRQAARLDVQLYRVRRRMAHEQYWDDMTQRIKNKLEQQEEFSAARRERRAEAMRRENPNMSDRDIEEREKGMSQAEREFYNRGGPISARQARGGRR
jgi:molecular chaperone DnaK (HSP70)